MKKFLYSAAFAALLLNGSPVWAQTAPEDTRYQNGRMLLDQKKYDLAMAEFLPLTNPGGTGARKAEASYLYAVAALQANKVQEASAMLQQLISTAPDWGNIEEAYYLIAKIAFDQKNYEKALTNLQIVKSDFIRADAEALERSYLSLLGDKNRFKTLLLQFPDDAVLARVYAEKLATGWYAEEDRTTLENLTRKFNLDRSVFDPAKLATGRKKDEYNVAVLLPFSLDADASTRRKNQFAADLYAGMKLAQDSLAKNNIKVNLFAYEASSDTATVGKTLRLPELKSMDLVIGPVYKATAKQAADFAQKNKVNVVNPLSDDIELVKNTPNLFLYQSSITTQAQKAADFAYDSFEPKIAAILFENTKDDTLFARAYRRQFEARGGTVKLYKKINTVKNPNVMAIYQNVDLKPFGHLLMVSENLPAAFATISQVESQNPKLPVMAKASWLELPQISLAQLDDLEIHFIYPGYRNPGSPAVRNFRREYLTDFNIPPSSYAYSGFEMLYDFGNLLHAYGPKFNTFLPQMGTVSGALTPGFGYGTANDNQFVPILKLDNRQLVLVNQVVK
ncbi:ABC transporter substrate-binding protein [Adhaeribacter soli]|uniref:ABC transporter substrate-binding protein n=1 Tax=Adhaeribacter soli TaxID=2607655 RepID=A0A5N1J4F9_9BACT|nr:ABC transporter substrate-binding protein [Adhaeribacter soli]KAA9345791.1 ABC transporter substrate-binding protein [Adhaeribacter soli]